MEGIHFGETKFEASYIADCSMVRHRPRHEPASQHNPLDVSRSNNYRKVYYGGAQLNQFQWFMPKIHCTITNSETSQMMREEGPKQHRTYVLLLSQKVRNKEYPKGFLQEILRSKNLVFTTQGAQTGHFTF